MLKGNLIISQSLGISPGDYDNMEQLQMEYWEMDFEKVNEFNFLNEEVEEFTSSWSQSLVNIRSPSYLGQKTFDYCS